MKHYLLPAPALLLFLALLAPSRSMAQTTNYQELIIRVPDLFPQRNLPDTKSDLQHLNGVQYVNFCESNKCLLLRIDRNVFPTDEPVMTVLKSRGMAFEIKEGVTISQIMGQCTDLSSPAPVGDTAPDPQ